MKKIALCLCVILFFWSCGPTFNLSYKRGTEEAINKNWDEAVRFYERALREDPKNSVYRLALYRAKAAASYAHLVKARTLAEQGKKEDALEEYEKALSFDPRNMMVAREMANLRKEGVEEKPPLEISLEPPVKLTAADKKVVLKLFADTSLRSIFRAMGKSENVNFIFDETFIDKPMSVDFVDMTFEEAIKSLCLASNNFYRVIDERTVMIAPDKPATREKYDLNAIKTFYLSNISAKDLQAPMLQMLRSTFRMPKIVIDEKLNAITIRDTPAVLKLAEKMIRGLDKSKGEVLIDLEIMEVSRVKLMQVGLDLDSPFIGFGYKATESGWLNPKEIDFTKLENFQISLPTTILEFLETDVDTKIISQPRLRGMEDEQIKYLVGDKIPVPKGSFFPVAAGGLNQQPVVNYDYEDVGIDVTITPRIHQENEVTLELEIKIKTPRGTGYADLPVISTREVKNVIRLKDGETNLLAGLLKDEERKTLKGIAGLRSIPLLGSLFSNTDKEIQQFDVILTVTPYIVRRLTITEDDLKPLWIDIEGAPLSGGAVVPDEEMEDYRRRRARIEADRREAQGRNEIMLSPANFEIPTERDFRISINIRTEEELGNLSVTLNFNSETIVLNDVIPGGFVRQLGDEPPFLKNIDNASGVCTIGITTPNVNRGLKGTGTVAILQLRSKNPGEGTIAVANISASNMDNRLVTFQTRDARLRVR